jgi:hypothetical protein
MSFWQVAHVRRDFRKLARPASYNEPIDYRPFDTQYVVFHEMIIQRPKAKVMRHMLAGENLALLLPRQLAGGSFHHAFSTKNLGEMCVISTKTTEQNNLFPLYLYDQHRAYLRCWRKDRGGKSREHQTWLVVFSKHLLASYGYSSAPAMKCQKALHL